MIGLLSFARHDLIALGTFGPIVALDSTKETIAALEGAAPRWASQAAGTPCTAPATRSSCTRCLNPGSA
jgi:hypothetical protein